MFAVRSLSAHLNLLTYTIPSACKFVLAMLCVYYACLLRLASTLILIRLPVNALRIHFLHDHHWLGDNDPRYCHPTAKYSRIPALARAADPNPPSRTS